jgi:hypothetical protein
MQVLKKTVTVWCKRKLISKLYMDQSVKIRLDKGETGNVMTKRGVKKEYCLLSFLFNLQRNNLPTKLLKGLETSKQKKNHFAL